MAKRLLLCFLIVASSGLWVAHAQTTFDTGTSRREATVTYNGLGTPVRGEVRDCVDCGVAGDGSCASGGTGAKAEATGSIWKCRDYGGGGAGGGGDVASASNSASGAGTGLLFKNKAGSDLVFKRLLAGTNVTLTNGTDDVTVTSQVYTISNAGIGGGVGLYSSTGGLNLSQFNFKNINAGSNKVSVTNDGGNTEVDIDVVVANLGSGTANSSTVLHGDQVWRVPAGGGDMALGTPQTVTAAKTFNDGTIIVNGGDYGAADGSMPTGVEKGWFLNTNASSRRLFFYNNGAYRAVFQAGIDQVNLASANVAGILPLANGGTNNEQTIELATVDFATDTSTGDGQFYFVVPARINGYDLVSVRADVVTVGTTGTLNVDLDRCAAVATGSKCSGTVVDMLSTNLTIDSNEDDSATAAAAAVINTSNDGVVTGDTLRVNIDVIHTTPAKGLILTLLFRLP